MSQTWRLVWAFRRAGLLVGSAAEAVPVRYRKEAFTDPGRGLQLFPMGRLYKQDRGLLGCDPMSTTALSLAQAARKAAPRLIKALLGVRPVTGPLLTE